MRVKLTALLADAVEGGVSGKISALGIGWLKTMTPTPPMAVLAFVEISADDEPQERYSIHGILCAADGEPVEIPTRSGTTRQLVFEAPFEIADHPGEPGTFGRMAFGINIAPGVPLNVGQYRWEISLGGSDHVAILPFAVVRTVQHSALN